MGELLQCRFQIVDDVGGGELPPPRLCKLVALYKIKRARARGVGGEALALFALVATVAASL